MIPESREVYEHGNREYDRCEERHVRLMLFLAGMMAGAVLVFLLEVLL